MYKLKKVFFGFSIMACWLKISGAPEYNVNQLKDKHNVIPLAIIGGGPAGLTAALYGSRGGFFTVAFQGNKPGGLLMDASVVENWPGVEKTSGANVIKHLEKQAKSFGAYLVPDTIENIDFSSWPFKLNQDIYALAVIIATGGLPRKLGVPGEEKYWGKGVLPCTVCDAHLSQGHDVVVVGGNLGALERIYQLIPYAQSITVIISDIQDAIRERLENIVKRFDAIKVLYNKNVKEIIGDDKHVNGIVIEDIENGQVTKIDTKLIFLSTGFEPNTKLFQDKLAMDKDSHITVKCGTQKTSVKGVFAAGNAVNRYNQGVISAGDASKAALEAMHFLNRLGFDSAFEKQIAENLYVPPKNNDKYKVLSIKSEEDLLQKLNQDSKLILIEFYSPKCPHCLQMKAALKEIASNYKQQIDTYKVNVLKLNKLAQEYNIEGLPTFVLFTNNKELDRISGEMSKKKLSQFINQTLNSNAFDVNNIK